MFCKKYIRLTGLFFLLTAFCACRKDLLHWQSVQQLSSGTTHKLNRILFVNDTLGFIAGGERFDFADLLITHDGGATWQLQRFPEVGKALYGLAASATGSIYAIGFEGKLLRSTDYGQTWNITNQRPDSYKALAVNAAGTVVMTGGISFDYGFIQRADAAGNRQKQWDSLNYELNDIVLQPGGIGYISAYGTVLKTIDDGATWHRQEVGKDNFKKLYAAGPDDVWICGFNGSIFHTTNGGDTWVRMRNGNDLTIPRYHLESLMFTDTQHGYAVGEQGAVIYTDDGGHHWSEFDRFTSENLNSITRCTNGDLLVCGDHGTLFRLQKK
jgi:photosystem II stability/assembly factor-like uncharacterized protein